MWCGLRPLTPEADAADDLSPCRLSGGRTWWPRRSTESFSPIGVGQLVGSPRVGFIALLPQRINKSMLALLMNDVGEHLIASDVQVSFANVAPCFFGRSWPGCADGSWSRDASPWRPG